MPKVVDKKIINLGKGMTLELEVIEYEQFRRRNKVIFWLGEGKCKELGVFTTILTTEQEVPGFSDVHYVPLYYEVKLTEVADHSKVSPYFFLDKEVEEADGLFSFDELDDADKFIEGLTLKGVTYGQVNIDSRASFNRWKTAIERVFKEE